MYFFSNMSMEKIVMFTQTVRKIHSHDYVTFLSSTI
jgi:hypothetical protein